MLQVIRWALIVPAAIVVWCVAFILGVGVYVSVEDLCPPNQMEFGHCIAPWLGAAQDLAVVFGAALAAALVMITCISLAPTLKRQVAITTFIAGTIVAIFMGLGFFLVPMVAAIITGAVILVIVLRRLAPLSPPNTSLERTSEDTIAREAPR